jgi:hypothetical protein
MCGELGVRLDDKTLLGAKPLILRTRLACAHDRASNPALNAAFETLPGTSFTVNGAPIPHNSALTSVSAELWLNPKLVAHHQIRWRSRPRLADLRRHRHATMYVVSETHEVALGCRKSYVAVPDESTSTTDFHAGRRCRAHQL